MSRRIICAVLAFLVISGSFQREAQSAGAPGMDQYTMVTDGSYNPQEQGYYGYFPVCCEGEESLVFMGISALVMDGHTYFNALELCRLLGLSYTVLGSGGLSIQVYSRTISFLPNQAQCYIQYGSCNMEYTMPLATVYQDEILWVGGEWFFWMIGGTFFPMPNGYTAIGAPDENVLDVLMELYQSENPFNYAADFGFEDEDLKALDEDLRRLDVYDGVLTFELDKWAAISYHTPQYQESMYKLITDSGYGADFLELVLQTAPDEAYMIGEAEDELIKTAADETLNQLEKYFSKIQGLTQQQADRADVLEQLALLEKNDELSQLFGRYANQRKYDALLEAKKSKGCKLAGTGFKVLCAAADFAKSWKSYSNRDQYSMRGAEAVMDYLEQVKRWIPSQLPQGVLRAMQDRLSTYNMDQMGFAFTQWFGENIGDYAGDMVTGLLGIAGSPLVLYKLGSKWIESYATLLEGAEAFEMSLIGVLYQDSAYTVCWRALDQVFVSESARYSIREQKKNGKIILNEEGLEEAIAQGYHYVKARYVTRELALCALKDAEDTEVYQKQLGMQKQELTRMKLLSEAYAKDLPLPSRWESLAAGYDDSYMQRMVTPAYLRVKGSFVDAQTQERVGGVSVKIRDGAGALLTEFISDDSGDFSFILPLRWEEEVAALMRQPLESSSDLFIPWKEPWSSCGAYPAMESSVSLIWDCVHSEYPELTKSFTSCEMVRREQTSGPANELNLNTGAIPLGLNYYEYLRNIVIPQDGLANMTEQSMADTKLGLFSADVRDYDGDGIPDMMTTTLVRKPMKNTELGQLYSSTENCLALEMRLYSIVDGEICQVDQVEAITLMDDNSGGEMVVGAYEYEGIPYIYSTYSMTDMTTYGPDVSEIYHVEDGHFVFDKIMGRIGWGQSYYTGNADEVLGSRGMNIVGTPLDYILNGHYMDAALNGSRQAVISISIAPDEGSRIYTPMDETRLREILEKGEANVKAQMPSMPILDEALWNVEASESAGVAQQVAAVVQEISSVCGISLEKGTEMINENGYMVRYNAPEGSNIYILCDAEGSYRTVGVYANGGNVTQEWLSLKDAVLRHDSFGIDSDVAEMLSGDCGFNQYSGGIDAGGGATALVGNAGTCTMLLQWQ